MIWSACAVHDPIYKLWDLVISAVARAACCWLGREVRASQPAVISQVALCGTSDTAHLSQFENLVLP